MPAFRLDAISADRLKGVHPDLVKVVVDCAANNPLSFTFGVSEGLRSEAQQKENVAHGVSQTMHSRHLPNKDGLACAVDLVVLLPGQKISWAWPPYKQLADAMKAAAERVGVPIEWGGDWITLKDGPHFQLPWAQFP